MRLWLRSRLGSNSGEDRLDVEEEIRTLREEHRAAIAHAEEVMDRAARLATLLASMKESKK